MQHKKRENAQESCPSFYRFFAQSPVADNYFVQEGLTKTAKINEPSEIEAAELRLISWSNTYNHEARKTI